MSVTSVDTDYDDLTITLIADCDAPLDQVWELWSDPRKLERWWGPPGYPATFGKHDLAPGAEVTSFMTGPDGVRTHNVWRVTAVDPPTSLRFTEAFADADGTADADQPVIRVGVELTEREGGTRMKMRMTFESREDMEKLVKMGTPEGLREAAGQIDGVLGV